MIADMVYFFVVICRFPQNPYVGYIVGKYVWDISLVVFFCCLRQLNMAELVSEW